MPVLWLPLALAVCTTQVLLGQCPTTYEVEIIVPSCSEAGSLGEGISETGDIAGWYSCSFGPERAFGWFGAPPIVTVPLVPGYTEMRAYAINPFMEIAGRTAGDPTPRAFLYSNGQSVLLPLLPNANTSEALALHQVEPGKVVGYCFNSGTGNPPLTAVYWEGTTALPLNLPLGPYSIAEDINDNDQIVGWMGSIAGSHGFIWHKGVVTDIDIPEGHDYSRPSAINNKGEACGSSGVTGPGKVTERGWIWSNGKYTLFDPLPGYRRCLPKDVNDDGIVVGVCDHAIDPSDPNLPDPAFIWKDGVMTSLRDLVPPNPFLSINDARGINNAGQIVASGKDFQVNHSRALRLTPILPLVGDVDCNRSVDVLDLLAVINQWGQPNAPADLNQDGAVNHADLIIVLDNWTF